MKRIHSFTLIFFILFLPETKAQPVQKGQAAQCNISVNNKQYSLTPNADGHFQRIANVEKLAVVPIEVYYPDAKPGEKIIISVWDGGTIDNGQMVKVIQLNGQKKCSFTFQVTNQLGLFRISLYKGDDTKTVQLWVGSEPAPAKQ